MPGKLKQPKSFKLEDLTVLLPPIFDQTQTSTANHTKNCVALYKLHSEAALIRTPTGKKNKLEYTGLITFGNVFASMLKSTFTVKKGVKEADRVGAFVGTYVGYITEKASEENELDPDVFDFAAAFCDRLLKDLVEGFVAKDKTVRYRVLYTTAHIILHSGDMDDKIYADLRRGLVARMEDKEWPVRVQAATALAKLALTEGADDDLEAGELSCLDALTEAIVHDPAPDVRRFVVSRLQITRDTLPLLIERTRDTDTNVRKAVYVRLEEKIFEDREKTTRGPAYPRMLRIAHREAVVTNGLGDREEAVSKAAAKLIGEWVTALRLLKTEEEEDEVAEQNLELLIAFLKLFDLAQEKVAEDALLSVFKTLPTIFNNLEFGDSFWNTITAEKSFLVRVFVQHCADKSSNAARLLESALPVVTNLAYRIQSAYNTLSEDVSDDGNVLNEESHEARVQREEERANKELILGELLRLGVHLDYSDENGRRKMYSLVRDMIGAETLPDSLVSKSLDLMRQLTDERDYIRVVVEIVQTLRDTDDDDIDENRSRAESESNFDDTPGIVRPPRVPKEKTPAELARALMIDLRCLDLSIGMLERVNGTFDGNSTLSGLVDELIIPSVKSKNMELRMKGMISLGLCCLINKGRAPSAFVMLVNQLQVSQYPEALKIVVLQIIFDMLMVHDVAFLVGSPEKSGDVIDLFTGILEENESPRIMAATCMGVSKLILSGMISSEQVLTNLLLVYFDSSTMDNLELRQCLAYFFPAFSFALPKNAVTMSKVFIPVYESLCETRRTLDDDEEMASPTQVAEQFLYWTNPLNANESQKIDYSIHLDVAIAMLRSLYDQEKLVNEKKALVQQLGKLHMPDETDGDKVNQIKLLINNLRSRRPLRDTVSNNALAKFETAFLKQFEKQLQDFNEEDLRKLEQLTEVFAFVDAVIPEEDEDEPAEVPKRRGKKRRSDSIMSTTDSEKSPAPAPVAPKRGRGKAQAKKRRLSETDEENDDEDNDLNDDSPPASAPTRTLPKRSAAKKKPVVVELSTSEDENEKEATPVTRRRGKKREPVPRTPSPEEQQEDFDASMEIPHDSIMDEDSQDEEEEVLNDLTILPSDEED